MLNLPAFSPYSFAPSLLRRTEIFLQTRPPSRGVHSHYHILRPADLFTGQIHDLQPKNLHIRRELQTFRRLPKSGAIVLSSKTEFEKLMDLSVSERSKLLDQIQVWDEDVANFKGRDLWITALEGCCLGKPAFRDDVSVFSMNF